MPLDEEWKANMLRTYEDIAVRGERALAGAGSEPHTLWMGRSSYLIALKHPPEVEDSVCEVARKLSRRFPVVDSTNGVHTTLFNVGIDEDYASERHDAIHRALGADVKGQGLSIRYEGDGRLGWIYSPDAVLVAGMPSGQWRPLLDGLDDLCISGKGSPTWGAHMTAARFVEKVEGKDAADFVRYMSEAPQVPMSRPQGIMVAWYRLTPEHFEFKEHLLLKPLS